MTASKIKGKLIAPKQIPTVLVSDAGDADFTALLGPGSDCQVIRYNVAVAAPRTVTLGTTGAVKGQTARIVRTSAATGASAVTFAGKSIAVSNWAEAVFDGSAWILSAFGSL